VKKALVYVQNILAGELLKHSSENFEFKYRENYSGAPVSLTLPLEKSPFHFQSFPTFFEGLLPEGAQLTALLRQNKIDQDDYFSQLLAVGEDLVGAITVRPSETAD
jgi:serine/threonine-protein kinase HipA